MSAPPSTNNGSLLIDALAVAYVTGNAVAYATLAGGIDQFASSTGGDVSLAVVNDGYHDDRRDGRRVGGASPCYARNGVERRNRSLRHHTGPAIRQEAHANGGGDASVLVDNDGDLNIGAYALANATSGYATAEAHQKSGIVQLAYATGNGGDEAPRRH